MPFKEHPSHSNDIANYTAETVLCTELVTHRLSLVVWRVEIEEILVWNGNVIWVRGMLFERHDQNWSDVFAELYLVGFILLGCHLSGCRRILHAYTHSEGIWHSVGAREASLTRSLSELYLVGFILLGCHLSGCRRILHAYTHSEGIWHSVGAREASLTRSLSDPSEYILWSLESVCPWIALDLSLFVLEGSLSGVSLFGLLEISLQVWSWNRLDILWSCLSYVITLLRLFFALNWDSSTVPCGLACRNWRTLLVWNGNVIWSFGMLFERHDQNWSDVFAELYLVGFILLGCHLSGCRRILHAYTHSEGIWHSVGAREASLTRSLSDPSEYILWSLESVCPWIALDLSLFVLEGSLSGVSLFGLLEISLQVWS